MCLEVAVISTRPQENLLDSGRHPKDQDLLAIYARVLLRQPHNKAPQCVEPYQLKIDMIYHDRDNV